MLFRRFCKGAIIHSARRCVVVISINNRPVSPNTSVRMMMSFLPRFTVDDRAVRTPSLSFPSSTVCKSTASGNPFPLSSMDSTSPTAHNVAAISANQINAPACIVPKGFLASSQTGIFAITKSGSCVSIVNSIRPDQCFSLVFV